MAKILQFSDYIKLDKDKPGFTVCEAQTNSL